jgi:queuine tRNA-ribosyltransferase subunit QTRTD1
MLGLPDHILVAAASDSIESLPSSDAANKFGASFETPSGRRLVGNLVPSFSVLTGACFGVHLDLFFFFLVKFFQVKPSDYMELISCMKPNIWATLADEVPAWVNEKRNKVSVDRTLRWLDACIALDVVGC